MKKIFVTLAWIVGFAALAALALNVLLPSASVAIVDGVEQMLYNATGMQFDFNASGNDLTAGGGDLSQSGNDGVDSDNNNANVGVEGFDAGGGN